MKFSRDAPLHTFLDLSTHENPSYRILEVSAGTGGLTQVVLQMLRNLEERSGQRRSEEYTYTDLSPAFFENARKDLEDLKDRITYRKLDPEDDPIQQGFEECRYDSIIAGSVLHVTSDLAATLTNLRRLLKHRRRLLLLEVYSLKIYVLTLGSDHLKDGDLRRNIAAFFLC